MKMRLSVIVPVYNERSTIAEILEKVARVPIPKEIIVVDDGSTDGTRALLNQLTIKHTHWSTLRVLFQQRNSGKGAAILRALKKATGEYCIIQDADLEYHPSDYKKLFGPVEKYDAKVVYGSRFRGERPKMTLWFWVGNRLLTNITNLLYAINLTDMETCYKLIDRRLLQSLHLRSSRFEFEPEVTAKIVKRDVRIYEVPISYSGRKFSQGKKISWEDGLMTLWVLLRERFSS